MSFPADAKFIPATAPKQETSSGSDTAATWANLGWTALKRFIGAFLNPLTKASPCSGSFTVATQTRGLRFCGREPRYECIMSTGKATESAEKLRVYDQEAYLGALQPPPPPGNRQPPNTISRLRPKVLKISAFPFTNENRRGYPCRPDASQNRRRRPQRK